jgi:hypothetical protein
VGEEFTWTMNQELDSGLMFSKNILKPSFDVENNQSDPS